MKNFILSYVWDGQDIYLDKYINEKNKYFC